jgi:hypothetical protein
MDGLGMKLFLETAIRRMMARIEFDPFGGCWLFAGTLCNDGYGRAGFEGEKRAHRVAWRIFNGPIPVGKWILHKCDVRCCVNPHHLYVGTPLENTNDIRLRRGFDVRTGELNPCAVLSADDVLAIRRAQEAGARGVDLAKRFDVAPATITDIKMRRSWSHLA